MDIVRKFNCVTFNIMGEMSFGDSWDLRLREQPGLLQHSFINFGLRPCKSIDTIGPM